jgi:predicted RNA polymerase sigma factor
MVTLNRIVALAMVEGSRAALERLDAAEADPALAAHQRTAAVRAHLLDMAGDHEAAREHYRLVARGTLTQPP